MNSLLHHVASTSLTYTAAADDFKAFFTGKVDTNRATTATAPAPTIEHGQVPSLANFNNVTVEEVSQIPRKIPNKQCELDPTSTWLVRNLCDVLAPIITSMANGSFTQGSFPDSHKHAVFRPRIKKPSLDPLDIKSYRPISNMSLVSKTVERLVLNRMDVHANRYGLLPTRQSAYRQHHSTETEVTIVHHDMERSTDADFVSALVLLVLSAAFDTVDHGILLEVLSGRFSVENLELNWFRSCHTGRTQTFTTPSGSSAPVALTCSVPQGSAIGPKKFIMYTEDIKATIDRLIINHHLYTDDSQLLAHMKINAVMKHHRRLETCVKSLLD